MAARSTFVLGAIVLACAATACSDSSSPTVPMALGASYSGGSGAGGGATGGGATGGATGGTGGGGVPKASCTNTMSVAATATQAFTGNSFSAQYVLASCQSKTHVAITATDLSTGAIVYNSPDLAGLVALWTLPYTLTTYRVDARAWVGTVATVVATASTTVSTLTPLPCNVTMNENATVGYWGIYPAVWVATDVQDCGQGGSVHLQITNLTSGNIEMDYPGLGTSSFIDFEGAMVSYSTPYRVYVEYRSPAGDLLGTSSRDIVSSPLQ
jgi:hypothetical protein